MTCQIASSRPSLTPWLLPAVAFLLPLALAFAAKGTVALLCLLSLGGAVECVRQRRLPLPGWPVLAAFATALAWGALSTLWQEVSGLALHKALQLAGLTGAGLLALAGAAFLAPAQRARVLPALLAGLALVALVLVEERLTNLFLRRVIHAAQGVHLEVRPWVEMWMYKTSAAVSGVLATLAMGVALRRGWWLGAAVAVAAALTMALLTSSMAGMAALGLGAVMLARRGRWAPKLVAAAVVTGFVLAPLAARLPPTEVISQHLALPPSALHRTIIWRFAASHIPAHPLAGWGLDASRELPGGDGTEILTTASGQSFAQPVLPLHPHNLFLQVWLELGAVGAVLAAGLLLAVARAAGRLGNPAPAVLAAALLVSAVSFGAWQSWWLAVVWMVAAMLKAATED